MLILIFVTVGSRPYPFNRLFKKIDELMEKGVIEENVFAQIGSTTYTPQNFEYKDYVSPDEFNILIDKSDIVISHGASGSIVRALKSGKKVIGVSRLEKYGEHIDNHQIQLNEAFEKLDYIVAVYDINKLDIGLQKIKNKKLEKWENNSDKVINLLDEFIFSNWD